MSIYKNAIKNFPKISKTEREALHAGDSSLDKNILMGDIPWEDVLIQNPAYKSHIIEKEASFLKGPVNDLCDMLDDHDINHDRADLPPKVWEFIKEKKFFGMNIPEEYGGLGFSARTQSEVIVTVASKSIVAAITIMVPNSLGPAELLTKYGTVEQQEKYIPNLATGKEIPCFALTGPFAGSDASNMSDIGYVGTASVNGKSELGVYLTIDKRYITLAPVATLVGIAFNAKDKHGLIGREIGDKAISIAIVPANHPGLEIGKRHNPLETTFMNGPIRCTNMFIPMNMILGGMNGIGHGWRMLMECLAAGRGISLPSLSSGGAKTVCRYVGAYARIRKQFGLPIGRFEAIEEKLSRIAGRTYIMDCMRNLTLSIIDTNCNPAVLSAVNKYHMTEMLREVVNDGMDILGGKGIMLGKNNFLGRVYMALPIAVTVEGANDLTRGMIIFGQGAIKNHPYIFQEITAIENRNKKEFNQLLLDHLFYTVKGIFKTKFKALSHAVITNRKDKRKTVDFLATAYSCVANICLIHLQGSMKKKERISARLGDIMSYLYMLISMISDINRTKSLCPDKEPLVKWAYKYLTYKIQESFYELLENYPNRFIGIVLKKLVFPFGRIYHKPSDKDDKNVANILLTENLARSEITRGVFQSLEPNEITWDLDMAFGLMDLHDPVEKIASTLDGYSFEERVDMAHNKGLISKEEATQTIEVHKLIKKIIQVDEFEVI